MPPPVHRPAAALGALLALVVTAAVAAAAPAQAAADPAPVAYRPPVDAPVADAFRPPPGPYGRGNRGVDFATAAGDPVRAAAGGEVVFAGPVAGARHVVVRHDDGLRSTYAFLAEVAVRRGDVVPAGHLVGTAGEALHFGVRAGGAYLDPEELFAGRGRVRLVRDPADDHLAEADERRALLRFLAGIVGRGRTLLGAGPAHLRLLAGAAVPPPLAVAGAVERWQRDQHGCTPPGQAPPRLAGRRIAVLVAGLGSSSGHGAVDDLDTEGLGYAAADVHRFSYRGGTEPYAPADTTVDIGGSAAVLAADVRRLQAAAPGVPVDLIAHSQGGLVARRALADGLGGVATLVTLGTPHGGADLATAGAAVAAVPAGRALLRAAGELAPIDPTAPSVAQLAEGSPFLADLADRSLPPDTRVVAVAAAGDWVVPVPRARLDGHGAANAVVAVGPLPGPNDHAALPGSPAAHREIALAVGGRGPTCQPLADRLVAELAGATASQAADVLGVALAAAAASG